MRAVWAVGGEGAKDGEHLGWNGKIGCYRGPNGEAVEGMMAVWAAEWAVMGRGVTVVKAVRGGGGAWVWIGRVRAVKAMRMVEWSRGQEWSEAFAASAMRA